MAKSGDLAVLRNKCAAVLNVALDTKKCRNGCAQGPPFPSGFAKPHHDRTLHADTASGAFPDHPQDAAE